MASTLDASALLSKDPAFIGRVEIASVNTARAVYYEDPNTPNYELRTALAKVIINNSKTYLSAFVFYLASLPNIEWNSEDADIQANVDAAFGVIATF